MYKTRIVITILPMSREGEHPKMMINRCTKVILDFFSSSYKNIDEKLDTLVEVHSLSSLTQSPPRTNGPARPDGSSE